MLKNCFKSAWRNMKKNKVFSLISVLSLALGIAACLVIYSFGNFELSFDTFHSDKNILFNLGWVLYLCLVSVNLFAAPWTPK